MRSDRSAMVRVVALLGCVLCATVACNRDANSASASAAAEPAEPVTPLPPAQTMHPDDVAEVTSSYDCGGIRVDIVRDQVARVNLAVDNIVKIERIANSVPATYQDVGLTFTVSDTGANLDDETGRSFACKPVAKPGRA
jgi:hypothetical protein